uniref:Uncharacterized protein n=1 Tax=Romanomermis culicivorax TaxID=13658 RepID=A0A915I6F1_ROMCU
MLSLWAEQKTIRSNQVMSNQRGNAQRPSSMKSNKIRPLKSEMVRLTAHIVRLTAQQQAPALRNLTPPTQLSVHLQNPGDCPSGAHIEMCSFYGYCTQNDASRLGQCPNRASPSNAAACYFC